MLIQIMDYRLGLVPTFDKVRDQIDQTTRLAVWRGKTSFANMWLQRLVNQGLQPLTPITDLRFRYSKCAKLPQRRKP